LETESSVNSAIVTFFPITTEIYLGLVFLLLLLLFAALVSGAEASFFSLSPSEKSSINQSKKRVFTFIRDLLLVPDKLISTMLIVNTFNYISIVVLSTYLVNKVVDFSNSPVLGFFLQVVAIASIILLFGEILPKIYASNYKLQVAKLMARPLAFCIIIFAPLSYILIHSTSFLNKRLTKHKRSLTIDDISQALELTSSEKLSDDKDILEGIVKFGSISVYQIMTPRIDVVAVEVDLPSSKLIEVINHSGYSRIPVYTDTFDKIEGILYIKDLLPYFSNLENFKWQTLLRQPYYIPENKKIDDLLKEFQKNKVHMAIVVDEYGGTSGIVTLEDILEEIIGDIVDEFDDDDRLYTKINDNTYLFDGKTQLNDFYRICNLDDNLFESFKGEADSLAGLILEIKNDFPKLNEKLSCQDIDFYVESIDNRRIKKIKVVFNKTS
jgi:gliding motility-associated protein GldE